MRVLSHCRTHTTATTTPHAYEIKRARTDAGNKNHSEKKGEQQIRSRMIAPNLGGSVSNLNECTKTKSTCFKDTEHKEERSRVTAEHNAEYVYYYMIYKRDNYDLNFCASGDASR